MNNTQELHDELVVTVAEAADRLKISEWMIRKLINDGSLRSLKVGSRRLIPVHDLISFLNERSDEGADHA